MSCVTAITEDAGSERELGRGGIGLLDVRADKGVGSERHKVEASTKLKFELSNLLKASVKIVKRVKLLAGVSGNISKDTKVL